MRNVVVFVGIALRTTERETVGVCETHRGEACRSSAPPKNYSKFIQISKLTHAYIWAV
jgi:hypothetical protein